MQRQTPTPSVTPTKNLEFAADSKSSSSCKRYTSHDGARQEVQVYKDLGEHQLEVTVGGQVGKGERLPPFRWSGFGWFLEVVHRMMQLSVVRR